MRGKSGLKIARKSQDVGLKVSVLLSMELTATSLGEQLFRFLGVTPLAHGYGLLSLATRRYNARQ